MTCIALLSVSIVSLVSMTGRPLLGTQHDATLFVGREPELEQLERAVHAGLNTVLVGERGVGSTSLVHALVRRLRDHDGPVATVVRCGGAQSVVGVLARMVLALAGPAPVAVVPASTATGLLWQLAQAVHHDAAGAVVLIVDDLPPVLGAQLLAEYREELWAVGAPWVVTVATDDSAQLLSRPGGVFFEVRLDLEDLDRHETSELLARRLPGTSSTEVDRLVEAAGSGHPRRVLDVARSVVSMGSGEVGPVFAAHTVALQALGRSAHILHSELTAVGWGCASDAALQDRMGWSRVRLQQVLTQLEQAGLVRAITSRPAGGQGRPRKMFSPVPPADWYARQTGLSA